MSLLMPEMPSKPDFRKRIDSTEAGTVAEVRDDVAEFGIGLLGFDAEGILLSALRIFANDPMRGS